MNYSRRQLYAVGEPLGDAATHKVGGKIIYGGGGGGGAPTSQTITQSNIPDWLRPQVETVLGGAMQEMFKTQPGEGGKIDVTGVKPYIPYSANPADYVAGFSPMQEQAMYGAANLRVPGQYGEATQMSRMAGMGGLGAAGQAAGYGGMGADYGAQAAQLADAAQRYGQQGAMGAAGVGADVGSLARGYAAQQAGAGGQYAGMATSPQAMQAYMSPFMQNVVDVQQQAAQRQADIANQALQAQAVKSGSFGGGRYALQQAQAAADLARQKQNIQAQGLQQAFQQAQQAQQFGAGLGLQGLSGAQQGLGNILQGGQLGLQGAGMGLQGIGQAGQMYGLGMQGAGLGLRGIETGLGGYGLLGQQAGMMGNLGQQELAARQGIIGTQSQLGGMQQQQQQNIINQAIQNYAQAQQYPLQTFNAYNALLRGYAVPGQTATTYQAAPSLPSQLAGVGMGAYGVSQLMKKKGGTVKAMAEGGVSEIDDKVRSNPTKYSEDQIKRSAANEVIDPQTAAMALAEIARARKAAAGINMLPSGLPAQGFAPGGIVAFEDGGKVERYQNQGLVGTPPVQQPNESFEAFRQRTIKFYSDKVDAERAARAARVEAERQRRLEEMGGRAIPRSPFVAEPVGIQDPFMTEPGFAPAAPRAAQPAPAPVPESTPAPGPAPAPAGGVATLPPTVMSPQDILAMATKAGKEAVPTGLAGAGLEQLTPAKLRELTQAGMPQGAAAYQSELTPMQERLAQQTREAAEASRQESQGILDRLDKLRASQEARYTAKVKDLETDRSRSVGIAFLEAAQAMTQPGQTFLQGLTRSAAAGGKRLMEDRERLDAKADKLADALERVDEARLGDRRERNAAETQYRNALLGVERELVNNAQTNFNMNKAEARDFVKMGVEREVQAAGIALKQRELAINAEQGAARNAIGAIQASAALRQAERPAPQLELVSAIQADPKLLETYRAMHPVERKNIMEYYAEWMKGAGPQVQMMPPEQRIAAFMAEMGVLSGPKNVPVSSRPTGTVVNQPPAR